jgi:hypothetical protein
MLGHAGFSLKPNRQRKAVSWPLCSGCLALTTYDFHDTNDLVTLVSSHKILQFVAPRLLSTSGVCSPIPVGISRKQSHRRNSQHLSLLPPVSLIRSSGPWTALISLVNPTLITVL